ncbi:unnamed protein product [Caenorhabditis bovis]|uniref:Uncharacterized protein n=1 Tax=Caenorhabditis bovis TaxID=2654633 RepID=A0A8S1EV35_9PELO|nr:unnamed protein product [Caenorhabditis bovis]
MAEFENEGYARLFHNFENVIEPKECAKIGNVPDWLKGSMIRNGPGMFEIGDTKYNHWFDGLAYMQRYYFENGKMFYSARFLESEAYRENMSKNRIVRSSFGTAAFADPCKTIFARFFSYFFENEPKHDNANVYFAPLGDRLFACTETPQMIQVDETTLESKEEVDVGKYVSLHNCTAHHGIDDDGNIFNIGSKFGEGYVLTFTENSKQGEAWEKTRLIGLVPSTDRFNPTYIHSFGMSQNYFVLFESPVRINVKRLMLRNIFPISYRETLYWDDSKDVKVFVMNKKSGNLLPFKITMEKFFTFHHANTYEKDGCIVVDYCRMNRSGNFDALLIENMKTGTFKNDPQFLPYFSRCVIPLEIPKDAKVGQNLLEHLEWAKGYQAIVQKDGSLRVIEKRLCEVSMEFPKFNEKMNMREYQFVYGSSILGDTNLNGIIKIDLKNATHLIWKKENEHQICGEPIFVKDPNGSLEDDGLLIVPVMTLNDGQNPFVLILDAKTLHETARFVIPEARIPLGFHAFYRSHVV